MKSVFISIITLANLLKGQFLINVIEFGQLIKIKINKMLCCFLESFQCIVFWEASLCCYSTQTRRTAGVETV